MPRARPGIAWARTFGAVGQPFVPRPAGPPGPRCPRACPTPAPFLCPQAACQARGIRLFVLPPRSPKLHGSVERANRTHTEEFYEVTDAELDPDAIRPALLDWEATYNTIRPHQALGYLTPAEFLASVGVDV